MADVRIFLTTTGAGTWTVPDDWNSSNNTIECIGGGSSGSSIEYESGEGGGGGAYSQKSNSTLTPGSSINYSIGIGGVHNTGTSSRMVSGTDTWFKSTSDILAKGATGRIGGQSSFCVGDIKYSGGNGGVGAGGSGGTGGGSAGMNGIGLNGQNGEGTGGTGDNGFGGIGGNTINFQGVAGSPGTEWDSSHGSGGGGGGGGEYGTGNGGNGGEYGAGGGGNRYLTYGAKPGNGANGIIVITYTPVVTGSSKFFQLF